MKNTQYNPAEIEQKWYQTWEENHYFSPSGKGDPYCIVIPPPNVTGTLHMGHGFQQTLMDALIRYHRMAGCNTLWQIGTDHAGIATQMVVENKLKSEGMSRHELGREAFIKKVWEWKEYSGNTITQQERRLGISGDWQRERFTLDEGLVKAVQQVFIQLYEEGLIYRGKRLVNWDPVLNTAVSDLEVISEEREGSLWHITYPLADCNESITIATTRPETMLGDVAVAVHPDDQRYQHLIGKKIKLPLTEREIPIIADEYVDKEFGTGCVKITPAHDFNDYAIGQRHQLPIINILTPNAHLNENTPKAYQGLERFEARKKILADLEKAGLLVKIEKHLLKIPKGDRSGAIIEPYLTDQWFVKVKELATPAIQVVKNGSIKFIPENWSKTYLQWLENIEDWCISRQLWWGHRIPAWFDEQGNIYVAHSEAEARVKYKLGEIKLTQETDVLDTWFSSALWPFSTLGWPEPTKELKTFYPTSVLVTGFDIIFFWVVRMVMMGLKFTGQVPFKEVYITGLIRDSHGHKMSKSKGNILDPVDLIDGITLEKLLAKRTSNLMQSHLISSIEKNTREEFPNGIPSYGTDALRFTFCALASTSRDINFDVKRLEGYRNFCTKIWNASRFIDMQTADFIANNNAIELSIADRWIRSELQKTINIVITEFKNYRFDLIAQAIYDFTWHSFCDWYLELTKPILNGESYTPAQKNGTRTTLLQIFSAILRLLHPIMPFITEELWQDVAVKLNSDSKTIMLEPYPKFDATQIDETAVAQVHWLQKIILAVRNIRGEMNIAPTKTLPMLLNKGNNLDQEYVALHADYLKTLAKLETINWLDNQPLPFSATALIDTLEIHLPLANLIDKNAEIARLTKEITKLEQEIQRAKGKLDNTNYVTKAPAEVVAKERERLTENEQTIIKLQGKLEQLTKHL